MKNYALISGFTIIMLTGCSEGVDDTTEEKSALKSALSTQLQSIEKAKGVEQLLQDGFNKRNQAMDEQQQ